MKYRVFIKIFLDILILVGLGIILDRMILENGIMDRYEQCLPGITKNSKGDFVCGDTRDPSFGYPNIPLSLPASTSLWLSWYPFFILILFNGIVWNTKLRDKLIPGICGPNVIINQNYWFWLVVVLRAMCAVSGMTVLLCHIIKFVVGTPRPNANTLYDEGDSRGMVSFVSGHIAIGYCNAWLFGLWCNRSLQYSLKQNFHLPGEKYSKVNTFNGNYWFFYPLWELLRYVPTISILIAWGPLITATYIGVTRIREFWHHPVDCVAGALIGIGCAYYFGYLRYYYDIYGKKHKSVQFQESNPV